MSLQISIKFEGQTACEPMNTHTHTVDVGSDLDLEFLPLKANYCNFL